MLDERPRCCAVVYRRDTYRVARGTKSGFKMHYDRGRCARPQGAGGDLCTQHAKIAAKAPGAVQRVAPF